MSDFSEDSITLDRIPVRAASPSGPSPRKVPVSPDFKERERPHFLDQIADPSGPSPDSLEPCPQCSGGGCAVCYGTGQTAGPSPAAGLDPEVADLLNRAYDHLHLCTDGDDPLRDAILARLSRSGGEAPPDAAWTDAMDGGTIYVPSEPEDR